MTSYIELQKQIQALQQQADAARETERAAAIVWMKEAMEAYGIGPEDVGLFVSRQPAAPQAGMAAPRPANGGSRPRQAGVAFADGKGNTWIGRGPRPAWLKEAIARGASVSDFAVRWR